MNEVDPVKDKKRENLKALRKSLVYDWSSESSGWGNEGLEK